MPAAAGGVAVTEVDAVFQPIVDLATGRVVAFEGLSRGRAPGTPVRPDLLLAAAAQEGRAIAMSERMRERVVATAAEAGITTPVFINCHHTEMHGPQRLARHVEALRAQYSAIQLVVEIHEVATPSAAELALLVKALRACGVGIAFDDFGSGQARLVELLTHPPDYLKFDRTLLEGIEHEDSRQWRMVRMLVDYAEQQSITTICEGIEQPPEGQACRKLGFRWGQGLLWGGPQFVGRRD